MLTLILVGLVGGIITSISPCVLPVLPVILASSARDVKPRPRPTPTPVARHRSWRPVGVVAGLVISFSLSTLFGTVVLSALHLPQDLLRDLGIAVLVLIGLSLLVPKLGDLLERPFSRLPRRTVNPDGNGLALGLGLGLLFVPCAGPVLATIAVVGATHHIGFGALVLTLAFGVGAGIPLLILAFAGDALARRTGVLRRRARAVRLGGGVVMIVVAVALAFNLTDALQTHVPGYTTALQNTYEGNQNATHQLQALTGNHEGSIGLADGNDTTGSGGSGTAAVPGTTADPATGNGDGRPAESTPKDLGGKCTEAGADLENCGKAPEFTGVDGWLNTPGDKPLTLAGLRGKVVLIDFWTYSCINCQRALPHVEAWYRNYARSGLVVVGVHTPEFAFEHVESNVTSQATALGVKYPIAIDNEYGTWNAYQNQYWPAEYLIDANGYIRHVVYGEGDYSGTEQLIRELLAQSHANTTLAKPTHVSTAVPGYNQTSETYLGYHYTPLHTTSGVSLADGKTANYSFPDVLDPDGFALSGTWTSKSQDLVAGRDAKLELSYRAHRAYLVLGGTGTVHVAIDGRPTRTVHVSGVPKLYTVAEGGGSRAVMTLRVSPGVSAYDFTFG